MCIRDRIIIQDDIDLEPGQLRIRKQGSAGGHNGLKDIIGRLGTQKFMRVKIGVGAKPKGWDLADHVPVSYTHLDVYKRQGLYTCGADGDCRASL